MTLADTNTDTAAAAVLQFRKIAAYEGWADGGTLVATGLWAAPARSTSSVRRSSPARRYCW